MTEKITIHFKKQIFEMDGLVCFLLIIQIYLFEGVLAAAVEAVSADLAFRQSDGGDKVLEFRELERRQAETFADDINHLFVLRRVGCGVCLKILVAVALKFGNDASGYQLHVAL